MARRPGPEPNRSGVIRSTTRLCQPHPGDEMLDHIGDAASWMQAESPLSRHLTSIVDMHIVSR